MLAQVFGRHGREFARAIQRREWWRTPSGIHFPRQHATLAGEFAWQSGDAHGRAANLLTNQALALIGSEPLRATSGGAHATYDSLYVCLWGNDVTPDPTWTDAYLALVAGEYGNGPEGYTQANRPDWVVANETNAVGNTASPAVFTIATASTLPVYGFAIIGSTNAKRSGASGVTSFDPTVVTSNTLLTDEATVFGRHRVDAAFHDWYDPSNDDSYNGSNWMDPGLDDLTGIDPTTQFVFAIARDPGAPLAFTNAQTVNVTYKLNLT